MPSDDVERPRIADDVARLLGRPWRRPRRSDRREPARSWRRLPAPLAPTTARKTSSSDGSSAPPRPRARRRPGAPRRLVRARGAPGRPARAARRRTARPRGRPRARGAPRRRARQPLAARDEHAVRDPGALERRGRVERDEPAVHHQADARAVLGLVHVVGGDEDGGAPARESSRISRQNARRATGSTPAVGSSRKTTRGPVQHRAGERQPLPHAARERARDGVRRGRRGR